MTLASHPTVIGLTGPFGAGCSTSALHLKAKRGYLVVRLSAPIRDKWKEKHPRKVPSREELQRLGDELRIDGGNAVLVDLALEATRQLSASDEIEHDRLIIDGIRNTGEIDSLRERFGHRFTLLALLAQQPERWDRVESVYLEEGRNREDFLRDDQRDRNEEVAWGQQVELCIDMADVIIDNSADVTLGKFKPKVVAFADLASGQTTRYPTQDEILMNMAYSSRHSSKCLKRHVGAVLVDQAGQTIGVGYNENPLGTNPCVEEPRYNHSCYRDIVRNEHFQLLSAEGGRCPVCGNRLERIEGPPWRCPSCAKKGVKTNLEAYFFPDRAMSWCTAVHAEVWAIFAAGDRARGATMYTTTFPCFQCAEKIAQVGIKEVCFTEAYADVRGADRLDMAGIDYRQFEGVRSSSFERIFSVNRPV